MYINRVGAPARRAAPTADSLIPAAAPTHPLRDTHSLTERQFCEICANVWTGRLGSTARGLVPQMARCRRHQKTVSDEIFGFLKNTDFIQVFRQSPHATNYMGRSPKAEVDHFVCDGNAISISIKYMKLNQLQCNAEPKSSNANPSQGNAKATGAGKSHLEQ